ncbi:putative Fe-S oxidoreductase [Belliella baltica DSM 15883]|uniref:Putative Fe-S oxidoreductase n=1 Tax=Belliella baltica (strain DSM 15883 / CIP 108006 / LMG 21964 / BA134) TaxID=866536 RepID=I3Z376_BELBD|nr:YkgJ family cysteine cluster protein [Belliella baltica]AFL83694.1 putative Fe-S oxidoreductase [Belliella baltica DSM 15883]
MQKKTFCFRSELELPSQTFVELYMNLREKSLEVRQVFAELDIEIKVFMEESQLSCISGCGACCANPNVHASVLEFLPLAFDLYEKGKAEKALELLEEVGEEAFCIIYKSFSQDAKSGFCSDYANRGMICRLFGSAARRNKEGKKELITCKIIKEQKADLYQRTVQVIKEGAVVPSSGDAYSQLYNIDFQLTKEQFPINVAIKKALEAVLTYMFYTENNEV